MMAAAFVLVYDENHVRSLLISLEHCGATYYVMLPRP